MVWYETGVRNAVVRAPLFQTAIGGLTCTSRSQVAKVGAEVKGSPSTTLRHLGTPWMSKDVPGFPRNCQDSNDVPRISLDLCLNLGSLATWPAGPIYLVVTGDGRGPERVLLVARNSGSGKLPPTPGSPDLAQSEVLRSAVQRSTSEWY